MAPDALVSPGGRPLWFLLLWIRRRVAVSQTALGQPDNFGRSYFRSHLAEAPPGVVPRRLAWRLGDLQLARQSDPSLVTETSGRRRAKGRQCKPRLTTRGSHLQAPAAAGGTYHRPLLNAMFLTIRLVVAAVAAVAATILFGIPEIITELIVFLPTFCVVFWTLGIFLKKHS